MRKSAIIGLAAASAVALAVAGIASANAGSPSSLDPATLSPASLNPGSLNPASMDQATTAPADASKAGISREEAERIALAQVPGGRVTETRIDIDHGRRVWNVHLTTSDGKVEVKVDVLTGQARVDDHRADSTDETGTDDSLTHDVGDDHGTDDPASHDLGDDRGRRHGGHGSDDGPNHG